MKNKVYLAVANRVGADIYDLVEGQVYKVQDGIYGVYVYDVHDNAYIADASKNAFDDYEELVEDKYELPKSLRERIVAYVMTHKETIYETVMDDTECSLEREILDPEDFLKWLSTQTE